MRQQATPAAVFRSKSIWERWLGRNKQESRGSWSIRQRGEERRAKIKTGPAGSNKYLKSAFFLFSFVSAQPRKTEAVTFTKEEKLSQLEFLSWFISRCDLSTSIDSTAESIRLPIFLSLFRRLLIPLLLLSYWKEEEDELEKLTNKLWLERKNNSELGFFQLAIKNWQKNSSSI